MTENKLFERVWDGTAAMEEWTESVKGGATTSITDDIIAIHTTYFCGNTTVIRTNVGLVVIDTGNDATAHQMQAARRQWDDTPVHTVIYTHGHVDHTWGARLIDWEADEKGAPRPRVIAHRNVLRRFDRYDASHGLNSLTQRQQFGKSADYEYPTDHRCPDEVFDDHLSLTVGDVHMELFHGRGETDDATFVWLPDQRVVVSGDFVIWAFPNSGNPRKVQRFAPDWAQALRRMQELRPEVLIPGHGPVIFGETRTAQVLSDGAEALESLTRQTLELMNCGARLDEVLHTVQPPAELLAKPWLLPKYDDPEFVVRSIWHLYAGWFDGNPGNLKPALSSELACELASLAGGAAKLAARALELAETGHTRVAAQLVEFAADASQDDPAIQAARARVLDSCIANEQSLIGKAIFAVYQREAKAKAEG